MMNDSDRISSSNDFYNIGDLSKFPSRLDLEGDLYTAVNSGLTTLSAPISFESTFIPVKDASSFPSSGLIVIDEEVIFYGEKNEKVLSGLIRGFSGKRSPHTSGASVKAAVCSDHHNSIRDAILNVQGKVGLKDDVDGGTVYSRLKILEDKFLTLKAVFGIYHYHGQPEDIFSFKDRSIGKPVSWAWEFGDGSTSSDQNPTHSYSSSYDGSYKEYDVSLQVTDSGGNTSSVKKLGIVKIGSPRVLIYTEKDRYTLLNNKTEITIIDQSQGFPLKRSWSFGDGSEYASEDPAENVVTHTYSKTGTYDITLVSKMPEDSTAQSLVRGSIQVEVVK